jgi:crotonobetainyl-CoA:carnitine CoA-transferase CaiB-like acyl-CoA transferase
MGLGPSVLHARNPKLIVVRISGFGQTGPYRERPGFGTLIEAMSGFADRTAFLTASPSFRRWPSLTWSRDWQASARC